ncbi:MAG: hypothetical protein QMD50_02150 [Patescibacteria group bacterium]|nr:hypothetical protein [Patescibacteria group bacterium]
MLSLFKGGQATLSFVLLVGGIIIEVAIAGSFLTYFLSTSGLGERLSARAFAAAHAGIRDAQIKITRNKELSPASYSLPVGIDSASVVISWVTDATNDNYVYTVDSVGSASTRVRRLIATLIVNRATGLVQLKSLIEMSIQ